MTIHPCSWFRQTFLHAHPHDHTPTKEAPLCSLLTDWCEIRIDLLSNTYLQEQRKNFIGTTECLEIEENVQEAVSRDSLARSSQCVPRPSNHRGQHLTHLMLMPGNKILWFAKVIQQTPSICYQHWSEKVSIRPQQNVEGSVIKMSQTTGNLCRNDVKWTRTGNRFRNEVLFRPA